MVSALARSQFLLLAAAVLAACEPMLPMRDPHERQPPEPSPAPAPLPTPEPAPAPAPASPILPSSVSPTANDDLCVPATVTASQPLFCPDSATPMPDSTGVITVTAPKAFLQADEELQLAATIAGVDATATVTWTSSDTEILTVSAAGLVVGKKPGTAHVTATQGADTTSSRLKVSGLLGVIEVSNIPSHAIIRPNSTEIWVVSSWGMKIDVIDACTNEVTDTISLGSNAVGNTGNLVFTPDGSLAYVSTSNDVQAIRASDKVLIKAITGLKNAGQLAMVPDGSAVLVQSNEDGRTYRINPVTNLVNDHDDPAVDWATGITVLPFGNYPMYVADRSTIWSFPQASTATGAHANSGSGSNNYGSLFASPNGSWLFVSASEPEESGFMAAVGEGGFDLGTLFDGIGAWTFFGDNARAIWAEQASGTYKVYQYDSGTLGSVADIPIPPPTPECTTSGPCGPLTWKTEDQHARGLVGITSDDILYMPVEGCSTVGVYQFY